MNMNASKTGKIDVHLKNSIAYILNPEKSTKELFAKVGGRQGYHYVLALKPGEGSPQVIYDIAMQFATDLLKDEYEAVVAVHTDRDHIHAHLVFNSVNLINGYKYQYHNGDWQKMIQPVTNRLCSEYGLHITLAEYAKEPQNITRPKWEQEQEYNQLIKDDAQYCAIRAESMRHFIFLLTRLGYEVKDGTHIAVKAPGMKKFRRIDTIDREYTRENIETLIHYIKPDDATRKAIIPPYVFVKRAKLTPLQKKYYAKLYRRQLIVKQPFKYQSAYLREEIHKMHKLQEEYLLLVKYDVEDKMDVAIVIGTLKGKENKITLKQKRLYAERDSVKSRCTTSDDFIKFRASAEEYHKKLEVLKLGKKNLKKDRKILERIYRDESNKKYENIEAKLASGIPVGAMDDADIGVIADVEEPENPYLKIVADADKVQIESEVAEVEVEVKNVAIVDIQDLPKTKVEYERLRIEEKVERFRFEDVSDKVAMDMVSKYLKDIQYSKYASEIYEQCSEVVTAYEKLKEEIFIKGGVENAINNMDSAGVTKHQFIIADARIKAELFDLANVDYKIGIKIYKEFLDNMEIKKELMEVYDEFDKVYEPA